MNRFLSIGFENNFMVDFVNKVLRKFVDIAGEKDLL